MDERGYQYGFSDGNSAMHSIEGSPGRYGATCMLGFGARLAIAPGLAHVAYWAFRGYIWLLWRRRGGRTTALAEGADAPSHA